MARAQVQHQDKTLITHGRTSAARFLGYEIFLDGQLAFTADILGKVVYDPATGTGAADGVEILDSAAVSVRAPQAVTFPADPASSTWWRRPAPTSPRPRRTRRTSPGGKPATATFSASIRAPAGAVNSTTVNEPLPFSRRLARLLDQAREQGRESGLAE